MPIYLITYDLRTPGKDYESLWSALKKLGARRALESVWVIRWDQTGQALYDSLKLHIDNNDRLLVARIDDWVVKTDKLKLKEL